jgi:muramoyltetrapeptide carboxypeptidase
MVPGFARGPLVGGNLALLASLCGTPWQVNTAGRILVVEEVGEHAYRIDRMLQQLHDAGSLAGVAGIALGTFTSCTGGQSWSVRDVLHDQLNRLKVPVIADLPIGHGEQNYAFPLGAVGTIDGAQLSWT